MSDEPDSKRRFAGGKVAGAIAVVLLAYVIAQFGGGGLFGLFHVATSSQPQTLGIIGQAVYGLIVYSLFLLLVVAGMRMIGIHRQTASIGRLRVFDPLIAVLGLISYYVIYLVAAYAVKLLIPSFDLEQRQNIGFTGAAGTWQLVATFISLAVIPPICEEIIFRGYLYGALKRWAPTAFAVIATSVVFAVGHLEFGGGGPLVWVAALFTFILSLVLIFLREKTGRLWPGIFVHAFVNGTSFYFLYIHRQ